MSAAHFADRGFHLRAGLRRMGVRPMRAIGQPVQALIPIPADPAVHRLTRHPEPFGDFGHRDPSMDFQHGPVPLLCHGQLHQH
jgi:hypothetical protein